MLRNNKSANRRVQVLQRHLTMPVQSDEPQLKLNETSYISAKKSKLLDEYDFIVVGAGSTGCVVASRLSENPNVTVLLIEAGNDNQAKEVASPFIHCPGVQNSERDWRFRTVPQPGTQNHVSYWPRGKTMGGSSSINFMLYVRGDPRTYDYWATDLGCKGWSYEDVLPYFKKSEKYIGKSGDPKYHGVDGPLEVSDLADSHEVFDTKKTLNRFIQGCVEAGLPENSDLNGASQTGAACSQVSVTRGVRNDTASAFLFKTGAIKRPNLTVVRDCMVTKILIQGDTATGVCLKRGNEDLSGLSDSDKNGKAKLAALETIVVNARKEVVLSAGAVGTPWLLMLSGIGPAEHLESKGIPVVKDLPVGDNLQDHMFFGSAYPFKKQVGSHAFNTSSPWHIVKNLYGHLTGGNSIFNYPWVQALAFFRSKLQPEKIGNDLQVHLIPLIANDEATLERNFGVTKDTHGQVVDATNNPALGITFLPTLLLPKSTGTIRLSSANPCDYPIIDPKYYSHPDDIKIALEAVKFVEKVAASKAFEGWLDEPKKDPENKYEEGTDEHREFSIRKSSVTVYHPTSTARMGPPEEPNAVVDLRLRVRGVRGLRVADCSVFPTIPSGNTNAPTIMVGERAADFIKQEWEL